jgi:hypothetical protein
MTPEPKGASAGGAGYGPHMKTVALAILVMGISIALVIVMWAWFGRIGPSFSSERLLQQQEELRDLYELPPQPPVPQDQLETPPSLRNVSQSNESGIST